MVENVLAHHDKELLQHLVDCHITSQVRGVRGGGLTFYGLPFTLKQMHHTH